MSVVQQGQADGLAVKGDHCHLVWSKYRSHSHHIVEREQASTLARAAIVGTNPDAPCSAERSIDAKHIVVLAYDHMLDVERGARLLKALAYPLRRSIASH